MKRIAIILAILLFIILMIFAVSNSHEIQIYYWPNHALPLMGREEVPEAPLGMGEPEVLGAVRPVPVFVLIFGCFGLGFAASWLIGLGAYFRFRTQLRRLRKEHRRGQKQLKKMETELAKLQPEPPPVEPPAGEKAG